MGFLSLKALGIILSVVSAGVGIASSVVDGKKQDETIAKKVSEEFDRRNR